MMGSFSNKQKNDALFEYSLEKKSSSSQCGQIFFKTYSSKIYKGRIDRDS